MKVTLQKSPAHFKRIGKTTSIAWTACEPFVENTRAILIHRVRHVSTLRISEKYEPHIAVHAWCGTGMTGRTKFTFLAAPPDGSLVCARCEEAAVRAELPTSDQLAGKHVHLGRLVAVRECCGGDQ